MQTPSLDPPAPVGSQSGKSHLSIMTLSWGRIPDFRVEPEWDQGSPADAGRAIADWSVFAFIYRYWSLIVAALIGSGDVNVTMTNGMRYADFPSGFWVFSGFGCGYIERGLI